MGRDKILDFRQLLTFVEVARRGSFTDAASRLGSSTASVSRTIARLESELDVRLFNRTTRRLHLTEEGQLYLDDVSTCLKQLDGARDKLLLFQDRAAGKVRALLPNTFCKNYLMHDMAEFLAKYPDIELDIHIQEFGSDPLLGGYDVGVQSDPPPPNSYIVRRLGSMPIYLVASPDYLDRAGVPRSVAELDNHTCIKFGNTVEGAIDWHLARRDDPENIFVHKPHGRCFFSSQFDAVIHAALCGVGIAPVDVGASSKYLQSGQLRIVLPDYLMVGVTLYLLYPHRDRLPKRTRVFIDFIVSVAAKRLEAPEFDPADYSD